MGSLFSFKKFVILVLLMKWLAGDRLLMQNFLRCSCFVIKNQFVLQVKERRLHLSRNSRIFLFACVIFSFEHVNIKVHKGPIYLNVISLPELSLNSRNCIYIFLLFNLTHQQFPFLFTLLKVYWPTSG